MEDDAWGWEDDYDLVKPPPLHFNCRSFGLTEETGIELWHLVERDRVMREAAGMHLLAQVFGCPVDLVEDVVRVKMKDIAQERR